MNTNCLPPTQDVKGAADILKVHPQTVLDLIAQCVLPAGKAGRGYMLLTADVLAYAEKLVVEQTAQRMRRVTPAANEQQYVSGGVSRRPRRTAR